MEILAIDHLVLTVTDIEKTVTFYEKLGMRRQTFGDGRVGLRFGAQKINLHRRGDEISPHAAHPKPGSADLCFLVADHLDDVLRALSSTEIAVEEGPVDRIGATTSLTSVYVRDPDGNLVELSRPELSSARRPTWRGYEAGPGGDPGASGAGGAACDGRGRLSG